MHIKVRPWVKITLILIIIIISFFLYSKNIGIKGLITKEYNIIDSKIPNNFHGLKIIQISDLHYNVTTDKEDLTKIVKDINTIKPDIVLFSGDMFDKNVKYTDKDYNDLIKLLNSIDYNIGKYAIKGEHDLKEEKWESIINDSGFININDKTELIYYNGTTPIVLVGISSNYKKNHIKDTINNIPELNNEYYKILLLHEPDFIDKIDYSKFNLILAGHSHNGQIVFPFIGGIIKNKYSTKYYKEYYDLDKTKLYISSGIGTSKYKYRFLNKPSINLYRLRNK